jgi:hypothetical protein
MSFSQQVIRNKEKYEPLRKYLHHKYFKPVLRQIDTHPAKGREHKNSLQNTRPVFRNNANHRKARWFLELSTKKKFFEELAEL